MNYQRTTFKAMILMMSIAFICITANAVTFKRPDHAGDVLEITENTTSTVYIIDKPYCVLEGNGNTISVSSSDYFCVIWVTAGGYNAVIQNVNIKDSNIGIFNNSANSVYVYNCNINNAEGTGIFSSNGQTYVDHSYLNYSLWGIYALGDATNDYVVTNWTDVSYNSNDGIYMEGNNNAFLYAYDGWCYGNDHDGFNLNNLRYTYFNGPTFSGNEIDGLYLKNVKESRAENVFATQTIVGYDYHTKNCAKHVEIDCHFGRELHEQ